ncbi:MAG: hypothetical protein RL632_627 [Bacteroidota bacterium]|jgi:hypothetical protein
MKKTVVLSMLMMFILSSCNKDKYGNTDISSSTHTVSWVFEDPSYTTTIIVPEITQDVLDNGAIMVYMTNFNGGWIALPCTLPMDVSYASTFTPEFFVGGVKIWQTDTDLLTLDPGTMQFKVVVLTQKQMEAHPDLVLTDYSSVEKALNL